MALDNTLIDSPLFFGNFGGQWCNSANSTFRLAVSAVREPRAGSLLALGLA